MYFSTLSLALVLAGASTALPPPKPGPPGPGRPGPPGGPAPPNGPYVPAASLDKLAQLFPQSQLPAPAGQLKYVVLGLGTQNYTCSTGDENAVPGTTGAVATLYDIGSRLNDDPLAKSKIGTLSPLALSLSADPANLDRALTSQGYQNIVGHHYFGKVSETNTPIFSFDQLTMDPRPITMVAKLNETDAPAGACGGNTGLPAIKWLYLHDTQQLSQGGIDTVYRVETAGGNKPATCKGMQATWETKYTAQCK